MISKPNYDMGIMFHMIKELEHLLIMLMEAKREVHAFPYQFKLADK